MAVGSEKDPERGGGRREGSRARRGEARRILSEAVRLGRKDASRRQYPDIHASPNFQDAPLEVEKKCLKLQSKREPKCSPEGLQRLGRFTLHSIA